MFKKLTFFVDVGVRDRLRENPALDKSAGYRRAVEMLGEFCRYAVLMGDYNPPAWINLETTKSLYKLMSNGGWSEGHAFLGKFRAAYRIECSLNMWMNDQFRLKLAWFKKGQKEDIAYCEFTIKISDGQIHYSGGKGC